MKKIFEGMWALTLVLAVSCGEITFGNEFLGEQPESSGATTEEMFSSRINSEKVLTKAYTALPYGLPVGSDYRLGGNVLESITDLCQSFRDNISDAPMKLYYNGALSANNVPGNAAYVFGGETDWTTIRYAWLYIENVDAVPDMTASEKSERKAEAKTLIAFSYFNMLRYVGGVTWLDHFIDVNEEMNFPRITFAQTVENIRNLLDEAIPALVWKHGDLDDGRMSKAGAMALKFKLLQWAASPTFNSSEKWNDEADEYTCYGNYDAQRWKDARKAGREFFDLVDQNGQYSLTQPTEATHRARRLAYRSAYYDRGGTEVLISVRQGYDQSAHSSLFSQRYYSGPTLNYVDMFPWEDGSDFPEDFDWKSPSKQPFFVYSESGKEMVPTRDPRLYENVACPGDIYYDGTTAPVYVNHASYKAGSGFLVMKHILQESSDRDGRPVQWSNTRLAEIMLGYAEAINEVNDGPDAEAYSMINGVRARVGLSALSNLSKSEFTQAVLKERALELGFEEVRWFDLVRRGLVNDFTKTLYGLNSRSNDLLHPTSFTFEKVEITKRYWASNWNTKWYLSPIPQDEINKKYGMTQNPGW